MEMFNVHRRDVHTFDQYMDLKNPGFGGPSSAEQFMDKKGKRVNKEPKLEQRSRKVKRDENLFGHEVFNPTYKAMGGDVIHKQEDGKNPYDYPDSYSNQGIPVVEIGEREETNEGKCYVDFTNFMMINEQTDYRFPHIVEYLQASKKDDPKAEDILRGKNKVFTERFIDELKRAIGSINEQTGYRFPHIVEYLQASKKDDPKAEDILRGKNKEFTDNFIWELEQAIKS